MTEIRYAARDEADFVQLDPALVRQIASHEICVVPWAGRMIEIAEVAVDFSETGKVTAIKAIRGLYWGFDQAGAILTPPEMQFGLIGCLTPEPPPNLVQLHPAIIRDGMWPPPRWEASDSDVAAIKASLEKHLAEHSVRVLFEVRALAVASEIQAVHDRYTELSDAFCHFGLDMESWDESNLQAAVQIARRNAARKSATQPFWSAVLQITKAYQLQRQQERTGSGAWKVTVDILADSPTVFGVPSHWEARCDGKAEAILMLDRKLADLPPQVRMDAFVEWAIGPDTDPE